MHDENGRKTFTMLNIWFDLTKILILDPLNISASVDDDNYLYYGF